MRTYAFMLVIVFFSVACQSLSQDKQIEGKEPEKQNISNSEEHRYAADSADIAIYEKLINYASKKQLGTKSFSEIEMEIANQLIGTPYVGHTLEKDSVETLVVNLRELDCTTFVENVLAISLCINHKTTSFDDYCKMLIKLRYRNGIINQYPSRLHYTTDWLMDNQKKGILEIVSEKFGPDNFDATVNFMSVHPEYYKQLSNIQFIEQIKQFEKAISAIKLKFVPKAKINEVAKFIKDGDMIALSTTVPGLDFSHVTLAAWHNNQLHFIHASSKDKKVELSDKTLFEYLAGMKNNDGIIVARLVETGN